MSKLTLYRETQADDGKFIERLTFTGTFYVSAHMLDDTVMRIVVAGARAMPHIFEPTPNNLVNYRSWLAKE